MGKGASMEGSPTTVAEENEITWIEAMLDRNFSDGAGHDHGRDRDNPIGHLNHAIVARVIERPRNPLCNDFLRRANVQLHFTAEKISRIEAAEHQVRVRDRRLSAAAPVTHRPRHRTRALGTHMKPLLRVEPGDGTAARTNL